MTTSKWIATAILLTSAAGAHAQEYTPAYDRIRTGVRRDAAVSRFVVKPVAIRPVSRRQGAQRKPHASLWRGAAVGGTTGALLGGLVWGPSQCGNNDSECEAITVPVGLLGGGGIGAAVGVIAQALAR